MFHILPQTAVFCVKTIFDSKSKFLEVSASEVSEVSVDVKAKLVTVCSCHSRAIHQTVKTRPLFSLNQLKNEVNWLYNKIFQRAVFEFWHENRFCSMISLRVSFPSSIFYSNRGKLDVKVPKADHVRCQGFSYYAAKMWNKLPDNVKDS